MNQSISLKIGTLAAAMIGLVAGLHATDARAQFRPLSQDVQLYAGETFGDRLTTPPLSGTYPQLDDSFTFGGRYTFSVTPRWGFQLTAGYSPSRVSRVAGGSTDFGLTILDLDLIWKITPDLLIANHTVVLYAVAGGGYAWANLSDRPFGGSLQGTSVSINNGNGVTGNAGLGVRYYFDEHLFLNLEGRYRYLDNLVSAYGQGLNTAETTLGVGYRF